MECTLCRDFLLAAGRAIVAHMRAVSRREEAVISASGGDLAELDEEVLDTALARENAVRAYKAHRSEHQKEVAKGATGS